MVTNLNQVPNGATWLRRLWYVGSVLGALGCGAVDEPTIGDSQQALAPMGSNAELVSASFKAAWYPGERARVSFTVKNSGTAAWTATDPTFALASLDRGWDWRYTATPVTVPVGASHDFDFVVTAPATAGDYSFVARMRSLGLGDFGATITRAANVTPGATPEWGCEYVASASNVPTLLAPNENRAVVVTVRNSGQKTWLPAFYLVSEDSPAGLWHQTSLPLNETVAAGSSKTWSFGIRAPGTPGSYRLRREMLDGTALGVGEFRRQDFCVDLSIEVAGSSPLDSSIVSRDFRASVAPGEAFLETISLRNTGTETWLADGSYVLSSLSSPVSLWGRTSVPVTITTAPGASASLTLALRAPATPGNYEQGWQLRKLSGTNAGYFGATAVAAVVVDQASTPGYGASVVDQNIPLRMTVGRVYPIQISVQNTGSAAWSGASFGLISTNLPKALWKTTISSLGATESVAPGSTRIFSFQLTAPVNVGSYSSSWRMAQSGGVGLFGQAVQVDGIQVTTCGNRTIDSGEACDDGNLAAGDGCSPTCQHECGNGQLDSGEACDDGNLLAGDGCSPTCQRECGNGQLDASEECDGGNFGGATCGSVTSGEKPLGSLSCTTSCQLDSSACAPAPSTCADGVVFADPILEQWVREALGLVNVEGPIMPVDAAQLGSLYVFDSPVSSLGGLECFTNLSYLEVDNTLVSDLHPLANLTQLRNLWLQQNPISDLTPLANLTELEDLELRSDQIGSLEGLHGLTHLMFLNFEGNAVSDLAPLAGLPALVDLRFAENDVVDLSPLATVPQLGYLDGTGNLISDLTALSGLTNLHEIYLSGDVSTLSPLVQNSGVAAGDIVIVGVSQVACPYEISNINTLRARGVDIQTNCDEVFFADRNLESAVRGQLHKYTGPITPNDAATLTSLVAPNLAIYSLSGLEYFTNLRELILSNNHVSNLMPLTRLTSIETLALDNNAITDLTPLAGLRLVTLALGSNAITDVTPLAGLTSMRELKLQDNGIGTLTSLSGMTHLTTLAIDRNAVSDLTPLSGLSALQDLRFSGNQVSDLRPLASLLQLLHLDGGSNLISDLTPLTSLTLLQRIYLSANHIATLAPLVQNSGITGGDTLVLTSNPLVCSAEAGNIQALLNRGVNLETDCGLGTSCVTDRTLVGTYGLQVHNAVRMCLRSDLTCSEPTIQDGPATFSLYRVRDNPSLLLQGAFSGPGLKLHDRYTGTDIWDVPALFYYPRPGDALNIWTEYYPSGTVGDWDESRAGAWVRVLLDTCGDWYQTGFVHIDIELATGRVIDFARKCDVEYGTFWNDYRMTGSGRLECGPKLCNNVENSASAAELVTVAQPDAATGCQLTSGTYHLASVHYFDGDSGTCEPPLSAIRETLVIDATTANTGTMSFATEKPSSGPSSTTSTYRTDAGSLGNLSTTCTCGPEELTPLFGAGGQATCVTSGSELKLQLARGGCNGNATYVYQKQ